MKSKKLSSIFIIMIAMIWTLPVMAQLQIAGQEITTAGNQTGKWLKSGTVHFDGEKTLTLDNAVIEATAADGNAAVAIKNKSIEGFVLKLTGENSVTSVKSSAIINYATMTITGDGGKLSARGSDESGFCGIVNWGTCTLKDCEVTATGESGIACGSFIFDKATVRIKGNGNESSAYDIDEPRFINCKITQPEGAAYDERRRNIVVGGSLVKEEIVISPVIGTEDYALYIAGTKVTSANCDALSDIEGITGKICYSPASKTLTLENATINAEDDLESIFNEGIDGLKIKLMGKNKLYANEMAILLNSPTEIYGVDGSGELEVESRYAGIFLDDGEGLEENAGDLSVRDCKLTVNGEEYGIVGTENHLATLHVSRSTIKAKGATASLCNLRDMTLTECVEDGTDGFLKLHENEMAFWDKSQFENNGKYVYSTEWLFIRPLEIFGLKINGIQVTELNCGSLSDIEGVQGNITYDKESRTLTLDKATITATGNNDGVCNDGMENLTIQIKGTCNITAGKDAIGHKQPTIITGNGKLILSSEYSCGIYMNGAALTIHDCDIEANGKYGIAGQNGQSGEDLVIRNATVKAKGNGILGSVSDIASLTLESCEITKPHGAAFDGNLNGVALNNLLVKEQVVMEPAQTDVGKIAMPCKSAIMSIHDTTGRRIDTLQRGINIIRTSDGTRMKVVRK